MDTPGLAFAGRLLLRQLKAVADPHAEEEHGHAEEEHGHAHGAGEAPHEGEEEAGHHAEEKALSSSAHGHAHGHEEHSARADGQPTLDLRIAAIFSIFAGALLAGLLPIFVRRLASPDSKAARALRTFAGGTILGLALVHIIPLAIEELGAVSAGYEHLGGVAILFGVVLLLIIDSSVTALMAPAAVKRALQAEQAAHRAAAAAGGDAAACEAADLPARAAGNPFHHYHSHTSPRAAALDAAGEAEAAAAAAEAGGKAAAVAGADHDRHGDEDELEKRLPSQQTDGGGAIGYGQGDDAGNGDSAARATAIAAAIRKVKLTVGAYAMEAGCIFHSLVIGIGLGVVVSGRAYVATMLGALTVHQALEGLSLGSVLARTSFSRLHQCLMALTYSLTTPIGIAIGIAVTGLYDPTSTVAMAVQGTLNGLSGGMLLHIALFQIVAEEFSREDLLVRPGLRVGLYGSLLLGAGFMCVLAVWA